MTQPHLARAVLALPALVVLASQAATQSTVLISSDGAAAPGNDDSFYGSLSFDGRWVAFRSDATNLHSTPTNGTAQIYVKDLGTWAVEPISVSNAGLAGNSVSDLPSITADGRFVVFQSSASNLVGTPSADIQVYLRDRLTGSTTRESLDSAGVPWASQADGPVVSLDGRYVGWRSTEANVSQLYLRDRSAGVTYRLTNTPGGAAGNGDSRFLELSPDGLFAVFQSDASDLVAGDTNGTTDVFLQDLTSGIITRISVGAGGVQANGSAVGPRISFDGRYVVYTTQATNIVTPDANGTDDDIVLYDRLTGSSELVNLSSTGQQANWFSLDPSVSWDGRYVLFVSAGNNLTPNDPDFTPDAFVRDRLTGTTELVNLDSSGTKFFLGVGLEQISPNGRFVSIDTDELLDPLHPAGTHQVYLRDRGLVCITPFTYCTGKVNSLGCDPWIASFGCSSASADSGFYLLGNEVRNNKQGLLFYGVNGQAANPFQGGTMCVSAPRKRTPIRDSLGNPPPTNDCSGLWVIDMNEFAAGLGGGNPIPELSVPGTIVDCQWWGRDPGASFNTSLTDAAEYLVGL